MRITSRELFDYVDIEADPDKSEMIKAGKLALRDSGDELLAQSAKNLNQAKKVFQGTLIKSGVVTESEQGPKYTVEVAYRASHAAPVEDGSRPHMPPVSKLKPWARKRLGDEKLAWPVAMKIKEKGTKPTGFFRRAWVGIGTFFVRRFRHHSRRAG